MARKKREISVVDQLVSLAIHGHFLTTHIVGIRKEDDFEVIELDREVSFRSDDPDFDSFELDYQGTPLPEPTNDEILLANRLVLSGC